MRGKSFAFLLALPLALASCTPTAMAEFNSNVNAVSGTLRTVNEFGKLVAPTTTNTRVAAPSPVSRVASETIVLQGNKEVVVVGKPSYDDRDVSATIVGRTSADTAKFKRMQVEHIEAMGNIQINLSSKRTRRIYVSVYLRRDMSNFYNYVKIAHFIIPENTPKGVHQFEVTLEEDAFKEAISALNDPDKAPIISIKGEYNSGIEPGDRVIFPAFVVRGTVR